MRWSAERVRRLTSLLLPMLLVGGVGVAAAHQGQQLRTLDYHGYAVTVPRSWPVFNLERDPRECVRFDRHAVYLGTPGAAERCPAHVAGRTAAILIEPTGATVATAGAAADSAPLEGSATSFVVPSDGIRVTATWSHDRAAIVRALHRRSLPPAQRPRLGRALVAHAARARTAAAVYTGLGFDACSAPSPKTMSAWQSSPYRAIGVYIGGTNAACSQPNLTATWVSNEVAAGWHLIPTYVGLQAPSNSCGCAGISPAQASAQGTAAADDAVASAQSLGLPPSSPIYDDMEYYQRTQTNTSAVMTFLASWTSELHAKGYLSGVYSNGDSGITDLVARYGTTYPEPDDIWIADWNGQQTTSDPYVPSSDWQNHQRLHQYNGGHNETYGGATINIDSNYLDGATADASTAPITQPPPPPPPPSLAVHPASDGTTNLVAGWSGGTGLTGWRVLAGTNQTTLTTIASTPAHGSQASITVRSAVPYYAVQALGSGNQVLANSATVAAPAHIIVYGHSAFVNAATGVGGIPAGCYLPTTCHVLTTVSVGRTVIATTGSESIPPTGTGILFFRLTPRGRALLQLARRSRLPVRVSVRDLSGSAAVSSLTLIPFFTSGRGPARSALPSSQIRTVGATDFVFAQGAGGILAACASVTPCQIAATLTVGRTTIASTRPELVGGSELGYLFFSLTAQGRSLLTHAAGNQLAANVVLSLGSAVARARIALVQFG